MLTVLSGLVLPLRLRMIPTIAMARRLHHVGTASGGSNLARMDMEAGRWNNMLTKRANFSNMTVLSQRESEGGGTLHVL